MPYVPSKKTDGKSEDREVLGQAVEYVAKEASILITNNLSLIGVYRSVFAGICRILSGLARGATVDQYVPTHVILLAEAIFYVAKKYNYEGAFLGELNYAVTRFIQRVPQIKVAREDWKESDELRYWLYACTVEALAGTATAQQDSCLGIGGVFEDIKDEYKRRVNTAYEAAQIKKSGDCYDTPYYTRLVEVRDEDSDAVLAYMEQMCKRAPETLDKDILDWHIVVRRKKSSFV